MNQPVPLKSGPSRAAHQLSDKSVAAFTSDERSSQQQIRSLHANGYKYHTNVGDHEIYSHPTTGHVAIHDSKRARTTVHHHSDALTPDVHHSNSTLAHHLITLHRTKGDKK